METATTTETTETRGGLTFEAARANLKKILGIEVVHAPDEGLYALCDTHPYRLRRGQMALDAARVVRLAEAALLRQQLQMLVDDLERADKALVAAKERVDFIARYYGAELRNFAATPAPNLRDDVAGKARPAGLLLDRARELLARVDEELAR